MPYAFSSQENVVTKSLLHVVVMVFSSSLILGVQNTNALPSATFYHSKACLLFAVLF